MPKGTREIRRKIKSIKNTRQITKAMELVAASKMRRAVANTLQLRPYARLAQALLASLSQSVEQSQESGQAQQLHPLLVKREVRNILVVVIATDRGLCGGLNTILLRKLSDYIKSQSTEENQPDLSFIAVGRKAQEFLRRSGKKIVAAYGALSNHPKVSDTYAISRMILQEYSAGTYDKVILIYTDFISALTQKPMVRRLLPLSRYALDEMIEGIEPRSHQPTEFDHTGAFEYKFEPSPHQVLSQLLPRLTEMQIYQAVLEAAASEHSARMFAMRNASDNAGEIISDLTLAYNGIRQAAITAELAEISAGRAALG